MDPKEGGPFSLRPGAGPKSLELREDLGQGPLLVPPHRCACLGKTGSTSFPGRGGHHELGALGCLDFPRRCPVGTGLAAQKQRSLQCNLIFSLRLHQAPRGPPLGTTCVLVQGGSGTECMDFEPALPLEPTHLCSFLPCLSHHESGDHTGAVVKIK